MRNELKLAILDDAQDVARQSADWSRLDGRVALKIFREPFRDEDDAARQLSDFDILLPMRERTPLPASLISRLDRLKMVALTGARSPSLDIAACTQRGILVCNTGVNATAAVSELAFALMLACARSMTVADSSMRAGRWQENVPVGVSLEGRRLGLLGLGRLGSRVARYGVAFGMDVVAWSQNLTDEVASAHGARRIEKEELLSTSDVVSLHVVLSDRTRHMVGLRELDLMKPGSILINTSRGPLVDEAALIEVLSSGKLSAGLDVFDQEPLAADHPFRKLRNVVLLPHLGYATAAIFKQFYGESLENIVAFLDGHPIRMVNPEALPKP
jgi:phosphoglycerate dehydrogenase-like enzyme